ncbi:MAG: outer membrane lipoprotein carrier protein LolA [Candidatus Kapaibacterium sp.]
MRSIFFYSSRSFVYFAVFLILPVALSAQTADEMAKELEGLYSKGAATTISFVLDGEKNSLTFANGSSKFRLESPGDLIVSDGVTIWHYTKKKKEVVIDKASSNAASLSNAQEILKFSSNYSGVLSHKKNLYELQLSPSKSIEKLMASTGGISQITFTFTRSATSGIQIKKVSAKASSRNISVSNISIKSVKKLADGLFVYTPGKGVKTTDLRD